MPTTTKTVSSANLARFKQKCDETYAKIGEGGGSGPEIPTPTTSDNGKVLGVSNGAYALQAASGGGGTQLYIHYITITDENTDVHFSIINYSQEDFTYYTLRDTLQGANIPASGRYYTSEENYASPITYLSAVASITAFYYGITDGKIHFYDYTKSTTNIRDDVKPI